MSATSYTSVCFCLCKRRVKAGTYGGGRLSPTVSHQCQIFGVTGEKRPRCHCGANKDGLKEGKPSNMFQDDHQRCRKASWIFKM